MMYHDETDAPEALTIYCSKRAYQSHPDHFLRAKLRYVSVKPNGLRSVIYDTFSILNAVRHGVDTLLLLGVPAGLMLPFIRPFTRARIVTNIDGIEWRRDKWSRLQRAFLRTCEIGAVRFSHQIIADNEAIAEHVRDSYGMSCEVIAYGGDHAITPDAKPLTEIALPRRYAFNVCRIEPENNVHMMLEAFADHAELPLVVVGNWDRSDYGAKLKAQYAKAPGVRILDPIYDVGKLKHLRQGAAAYIHGHSAGGTNPSLVEAMFFGVPVLAFDCNFNRYTTENQAQFFASAEQLRSLVTDSPAETLEANGAAMKTIAERRYTWDAIGGAYFKLLRSAR